MELQRSEDQGDPLVSITIISYNQAHYLEACLESVLSQTYSNIEVIASDDCSTDGSWELIQRYQVRHPDKIKGFRNETNLGLIGNRDASIRRANGRFVA